MPAPYPWPVKPFNRQHPVRAYFNDPRILDASHAFHFGIDVSAPNGTAVYAVAPGTVFVDSATRSPRWRTTGAPSATGTSSRRSPTAKSVRLHQLLGHIEAPLGPRAPRRDLTPALPRPACGPAR